jgi:hypothetical protein
MAKPAKKKRQLKKQLHKWKLSDMNKAVDGVNKGLYSPYSAARKFNVPRSTLRRNLSNGEVTTKLGRKPVLSEEIEKRLVKWIIDRQQTYMCVRRSLANQKISNIMKKLGKTFRNGKTIPSHRWWGGFLKRRPKISFRRPTRKETVRQRAERKKIILLYFKRLYKVIKDLGLTPDRIWNYDETKVISELLERSRVLALKGSDNAPVNDSSANKHISALACISASGKVLPPAFIFQQPYPPDVLEGAPRNSSVVRTPTGYITAETFADYFDSILDQLPKKRPLLLIVDGHSSHFSLRFLKKAKEENVHVFCFPSHLTHLLQPLDVTIFGPLKKKYVSILEDWVDENPRKKLGPKTLISCYCEAWRSIFTSKNIKTAFRKSGIVPRNPSVVLNKVPPPSKDISSVEDSDLEDVDEILNTILDDEDSSNESSATNADVAEESTPQTVPSAEVANPTPAQPTPPKYVPKKLSKTLLTHESIISQIELQTAEKIAKEREKQDKKRMREENKKKKEQEKRDGTKKRSNKVCYILIQLRFFRRRKRTQRNQKKIPPSR